MHECPILNEDYVNYIYSGVEYGDCMVAVEGNKKKMGLIARLTMTIALPF